jgi:hypothetical protein
MSSDLQKILDLEIKLDDYTEQGLDASNSRCESIILKMSKLLQKLNNSDLIYILQNGTSIHKVIDVDVYFKKYKINKKEIKEKNTYKDEFRKLNTFIEMVRDVALSEDEYMYICNKCDVDNIALFLLSNMKNEDIMSLSQESDDWNYKLFLYGNLKK